MKKRLLAIILSLTMMCSGVPVGAAEHFECDEEIAPEGASVEASVEATEEELLIEDEPGISEGSEEGEQGSEEGEQGSEEGEQGSEEGEQGSEEAISEGQDQEPGPWEGTENGHGEGSGEEELPGEESSEGASDEALEEGAETEDSKESLEEFDEEWLRENDFTVNEDGMLETVDDEGTVWTYDPEDPELFKYYDDDQEEIHLNLLDEDSKNSFMGGGVNPDPYVFKLDKSRSYSYPGYYKTDDDSKRVAIRYGIDVSYHQQDIPLDSWRKMKDYGIEFAYIRVGFRGYGSSGSLNLDKCYQNNIERAKAAGLQVGVYFFSQAITIDEAKAEANKCMDAIAGYRGKIDLPVVIDYEYSGDSTTQGRLKNANLSPRAHTDIVNAFCDEVKSGGYKAGIYAGKNMIEKDMILSNIGSSNYIWMANYVNPDSNGLCSTSYNGRLNAWQFTSKFSGFDSLVRGTPYVDLNFWYGDFPGEYDKLSYKANGGTGTMEPAKGSKRSEVTVAKNKFKKVGHSFVKWNTAPDGSGTDYYPGDKYILTDGNDVLYAIWQKNIYKLTFNANGGMGSYEPQEAEFGSPITKPSDPTREGYIFTGWYTENQQYSRKWDFDKDTLARDTILYAGWEFDESSNWGDLAKPENADIKAMYSDPSMVPNEISVYGWKDEVTYTGKAITFSGLKAFYGKKRLTNKKDYTLKYTSNKKAGKAKLTITGKGNYSSKKVLQFTIKPIDITDKVVAPDVSVKYSGKVQKAGTTVIYKADEDSRAVTLKAGTDFTFVYPNTGKKDPGYDPTAFKGDPENDTEYTVTIDGKGNYTGTATFTETILKKETEDVPVSKLKISKIKPKTLTRDEEGNVLPIEPEPVVKYGGEVLEKDAEDGYSLEYDNNTTAGTGIVYVIGQGRFKGTRKLTFKIKGTAISKAKLQAPLQTGFIYNGEAKTQEGYGLKYKNPATKEWEPLVEGRDYYVTYSNNVAAGKKAAIIFRGMGTFTGTLKKTYTIKALDIRTSQEDGPSFDLETGDCVGYTKGNSKVAVRLTYKNGGVSRQLVQGTDYTIKYLRNTKVYTGSNTGKMPTVKITGKGNFKGTISRTFRILPENLKYIRMTVSDVTSIADTTKPVVKLYDANGKKLSTGVDYNSNIKVTYADGRAYSKKDNIAVGTKLMATVTGKGNYEGTVSGEFTLVRKSIAGAKVTIKNQYYTGRRITITPEDVTVKIGKTVLDPSEYEVVQDSYTNNLKKGTAQVIIRGKDSYGGLKVASFKIVSRPIK